MLAFILRFYHLGINPPSLYWDEASLGYNAYSILKTGKDEHGDFLPLTNFKAFGDYKPPVYIYLSSLSIALFGKNDFSVRFPSAFFGTIAVLCAYFIIKYLLEIFFSENNIRNNRYKNLPFLSSFFVAISPWAINLSRVAFEANISWGLFMIALSLFLSFLKKQKENLTRKSILMIFFLPLFFVLPFYTFNSSRIFIPLFLFVLLFFFRKYILKKIFFFIFSGIFFIILLSPLIPHLLSKEGQLRFQEVNIFTDPSPVQLANERISQDNFAIWSKIINNRRIFYTQSFLKHFFDNFDFKYLFLTGDINSTFSTQKNGQLYIFDLLFIPIGLITLWKNNKKFLGFLLAWLFAGIFPSALARETPHALRTLNTLPVWQIFSAFGGYSLYLSLTSDKKISKNTATLTLSLLVITSTLYYLYVYYFLYPKFESQYFQYGNKEAVEFVMNYRKNYNKIYFSSVYGRPYIYFLWYGGINPNEYWKNAVVEKDNFGFYSTKNIGNIFFQEYQGGESNALLVSPPKKSEDGLKIIKKIKFLNNQDAYWIIAN